MHAQTFPTDDPVNKRMWDEGMTAKSKAFDLAQSLLDSIGPRLAASPGYDKAVDWALRNYQMWGIPARKEQYGTWMGWERGFSHLDMTSPRVRTLEATLLAWSPGTKAPVEGDVVLLPEPRSADEFTAWLRSARGKFVMVSYAESTCPPDDNWDALATPESADRMKKDGRLRKGHGANGSPRPAGHWAWRGSSIPWVWQASSPRTSRTAGASTRSSTATPGPCPRST